MTSYGMISMQMVFIFIIIYVFEIMNSTNSSQLLIPKKNPKITLGGRI